jgi:hypothetical protein
MLAQTSRRARTLARTLRNTTTGHSLFSRITAFGVASLRQRRRLRPLRKAALEGEARPHKHWLSPVQRDPRCQRGDPPRHRTRTPDRRTQDWQGHPPPLGESRGAYFTERQRVNLARTATHLNSIRFGRHAGVTLDLRTLGAPSTGTRLSLCMPRCLTWC